MSVVHLRTTVGIDSSIREYIAKSTDTLPAISSPGCDGSKAFLWDTNKVMIFADNDWNESTIQPVWNVGGS